MLATAKLFRATSHHTSALIVKRNILTSDYIPHPLLSRHEFNALALNLLTFANCYVHVKRNRFGGVVGLGSRPALNMRRALDLSSYYQLGYDQINNHKFEPQDMIHIFETDIGQEIYGIPNYLSSVNAILLNEAATLFRRRYYKNGAHAGFILHMTDALQSQQDVDDLEDSLENSKGAGNFKNLLVYTPGGTKDGVKVIPLAEVAAKDEFYNIKIASRDDQLAGHRIPPQLIGVVPQNAGGFGDIEKAAKVFYYNEIVFYQNLLKQVNERLGVEVIKFKNYELLSTSE
ncbi:phage portal protein [Acinetobacter sp. ANC 4973]|nr:phage portal protein [Acinetobacter sp. ANC 4973]OTG95811.1 phage portal protein [Acinetobacter sp. ANC 4973]